MNDTRLHAIDLLTGVFHGIEIPNAPKNARNTEKCILNRAVRKSLELNFPASWECPEFYAAYARSFRRVKWNLVHGPFCEKLRTQIREGQIKSWEVVDMTNAEMCPETAAKHAQELADHIARNFVAEDDPEPLPKKTSGMFRCGKCRGFNIETRLFQTRSADEPMTVFALCLECGHRWRQ